MKKIAIFSMYLAGGGVEVSLLALIKNLKINYHVTLFVVNNHGKLADEFANYVDEKFEIVELKEHTIFNRLAKNHPKNKVENTVFAFINRINNGILKIFNRNILLDFLSNYISINFPNKYDLILDYHGYGYIWTRYIAKQEVETIKCMWIHDESMNWLAQIKDKLNSFQYIFGVAPSCVTIFNDLYPEFIGISMVFYNLIDIESIEKKANDSIAEHNFINKHNRFLTIARLEKQKGIDVLVDVANLLKMDNIDFEWIVVGDGSQKKYIADKINKLKLQHNVKLIGYKKNPYPYLLNSTMYIQPSRHEGFGLAVAEAIFMKKIVVATRLPCIESQVINGETGILCDFDSNSFYYAIKSLIIDEKKCMYLQDKINNESKIINGSISILDNILIGRE